MSLKLNEYLNDFNNGITVRDPNREINKSDIIDLHHTYGIELYEGISIKGYIV